jgi:UMF1 family MFS transporter
MRTLMSLTTAITGNARWSTLGIIPLFLIGLVIFMTIPKEQK